MRRVLALLALALSMTAVLAGSVSANNRSDDKRNARSGVAVFQLAGPTGAGQVRGLGVIVQRGKRIDWWVSGSGLPPGSHAQHIHGPGSCAANAPIILPLADIQVQADGTFFASGHTTTKLKIAAGRNANYWNVHELSTAAGVGAGVTCGERSKVLSVPGNGGGNHDD